MKNFSLGGCNSFVDGEFNMVDVGKLFETGAFEQSRVV